MTFLPLDGPAVQTTLSVTAIAVTEAKVGASAYAERLVITLQPSDGKIYVYFGDGSTIPSVADVQNHGLLIYKNAKETYEAGQKQELYILALSGTVAVKIVERA